MAEQITQIPARLKNIANNGHVAGALDIIDDVLNKTQDQINQERIDDDTALRNAIQGLSQSEIVIGPLPQTGEAGKIYRVPGTNSYSDYSWNGSQFVLMATYNNGVDDVPTAYSDNLAKSGGIYSAIFNEVHPQIRTTQPVGGMLPNVLYELGTLSGSVTFSLAAGTQGIVNHYYWTFDTGDNELTVTWPQEIIKWSGDSDPEIGTNSHYEISVLDGVGVYIEI